MMGTARTYERAELEFMTTCQLREICRREKIMNGILSPLDKEELIRTILRFVGKKQDLLIREYREHGKERIQSFLEKCRIVYEDGHGLYCSSKIVAYEGLAMESYDGYTIPYKKEFAGTNALLIGSDLRICAILNLEEKNGENEYLYLTKSAEIETLETNRKDYRIFCVKQRMSECLYHLYYENSFTLPEHIEVCCVPLIDFTIKKPVALTLPMAIDFGTVHTIAGVYLDAFYCEAAEKETSQEGCRENNIRYTAFWDGEKESIFLPSVIGVSAIEENDYKLLFGYDAVRLSAASYVDEGFCVFYDIKRWIGEHDREEEITDRQGHRRFVKRSELLRRFFLYIIQMTENRFKCRILGVCLLSPVKQKSCFRTMLGKVLPEYMINPNEMPDEGMAVLYNTIIDMIEQDVLEEHEAYEALLVDCGGGTTDLCSCRFHIENRRAAYQIFLETAYENGDTGFGGNNLTYRVMQILKIALVHAAEHGTVRSVSEMIKSMDTDLYRLIEEHGTKAFYGDLDQEYAKAEAILPTRYADYERYGRSDYYKVKNNFYTLFDAAERVKKQFYGTEKTLQVRVAPEKETGEKNVVTLDKWKLSFREESGLAVKKTLPKIELNFWELELVLAGEIYGMVYQFMDDFYQSGRIQEFSFIKLTGHSCRIGLFRDALKEFVPGKRIQFRKRAEGGMEDNGLKTACMEGALKYLRDKKHGLADIRLSVKTAVLPYRITAYTHTGTELVLVDGFGDWDSSGTIARNMEDLTLHLYLKNRNGEELYRFCHACRQADFVKTTYRKIHAAYGDHILQKETDAIENGEVKFFVWAKQDEWSFCVVPVCCREDELYLGKGECYPFENAGWVSSYFDGRK